MSLATPAPIVRMRHHGSSKANKRGVRRHIIRLFSPSEMNISVVESFCGFLRDQGLQAIPNCSGETIAVTLDKWTSNADALEKIETEYAAWLGR